MNFFNKPGWNVVVIQFIMIGLILFTGIYEHNVKQLSWNINYIYIGCGTCVAALIGLVFTIFNFGQKITPFPSPTREQKFVSTGIYSIIRHPMYLFITLALMGYTIILRSRTGLIMCIFLLFFFDRKMKMEEKYMRDKFPGYSGYQERTKRMIPFIY